MSERGGWTAWPEKGRGSHQESLVFPGNVCVPFLHYNPFTLHRFKWTSRQGHAQRSKVVFLPPCPPPRRWATLTLPPVTHIFTTRVILCVGWTLTWNSSASSYTHNKSHDNFWFVHLLKPWFRQGLGIVGLGFRLLTNRAVSSRRPFSKSWRDCPKTKLSKTFVLFWGAYHVETAW